MNKSYRDMLAQKLKLCSKREKGSENMIEIKGKFNTAQVFTDLIDEESIRQIKGMCDQEAFAGSQIRIMPDVHAGKGCTIGTTMTVTDKVVPNLVGVDIGCGMEVFELENVEIDYQRLDEVIRERIPSGFAIRETAHPFLQQVDLKQLRCFDHIDEKRAELSLGTLGGGNHFIEVDVDSTGTKYLVIHSGSRHLGVEVANYYQNAAYKTLLNAQNDDVRKTIIETLKAQGRAREIQETLAKFKPVEVSKDFSYCEGDLFASYIHDMKITQAFASLSRQAMGQEILDGMGIVAKDHFATIHNYIDVENMILRKGAVSAQKDEILLIPINMRDGSLICRGKGNPDWNYSAPHGAGRLYSRSQAKDLFSLDEFASSMEGIYTTSVLESTIDEAPMVYKPMESILANIQDTVEVLAVIRPTCNFKAS